MLQEKYLQELHISCKTVQDGFTGYLLVQRSIKQYCIMATDRFIAATFDAIFGCLVSNGFENILLSTLIHFYPSEAS